MSKGENVSGVFLAVVWAIEAAMIVGVSTYFARKAIVHRPFCENCGCWTVPKTGERALSLAGAKEPLASLMSGNLSALMNFDLAHNENLYLQLDMARCPTCSKSNFLTLTQVTRSLNKEGKLKIERKPLLHNMVVDVSYLPLIENVGHELPSPEVVEEKSAGNNLSEPKSPKV